MYAERGGRVGKTGKHPMGIKYVAMEKQDALLGTCLELYKSIRYKTWPRTYARAHVSSETRWSTSITIIGKPSGRLNVCLGWSV